MSIEISKVVRTGTNKQIFCGQQLRTCLWGTSTTETCTNGALTIEYADAYWASMQALTGSALTLKHNYGHYGYTTAQIYDLLPAEYSADPDFDLAILQLAANDIPNAGVDYTLVRNFIEYLLFRGKKIILVIPYARVPNTFPERYAEFKAFCEAVVKLAPDLVFIADFYSAISESENPSQYFQPDFVHLNSNGAYKAGAAFRQAVSKIVGPFDFYPYGIGSMPILSDVTPLSGFTVPSGGSLSSPYEYETGRLAVDFSISNSSSDNLFITKSGIQGLVLDKKYRFVAQIKAKTNSPVPCVYIRSGDSSISRKMRDEDVCYFTPKSYATMAIGDTVSFASIPFIATAAEVSSITAVIAFRACAGKTFSTSVHYFDIVEAE